MFKERGLSGTSTSDIAAAANAFPSQITDYFRTKEALFVETACRDDALALARRRQHLAPLVERTMDRLHGEGRRAFAGQVER